MPEVRIAAEQRTEFGKGAARRVRRAKKVPAVLYGHGAPPRHISLPGHELMLALKTPNVLFDIAIDGSSELALPKDIQRDPVKNVIEHVDLIVVSRGEKVTIDVPIVVTGEAAPETMIVVDAQSISVEAEATHIPQSIEVSVEGLRAGTLLHASDLVLPAGVTLQADPELLILNVTAEQTAEQAEAEIAAAEAEAGIVHEEKTDPDAETATPAADDEDTDQSS